MRKWARLGIAAALIPVLLLAASGIYALLGYNNSGDGSPFLGFALARPVFAQIDPAALAFLETEAGLSAYTQLSIQDQGNVDLDILITQLFTDVEAVGDNYVIGKMTVINASFNVLTQVFLYADTDGWLVASLPNGKEGAEALIFYSELPALFPFVGFTGRWVT